MHDLITLQATLVIIPLLVVLAAVFYYLTKGKSTKIKLIPFAVIAFLIFFGEIAKQINEIVFIDGPYDWYRLPLHICSIFIISLPLAVILKQKSKASNLFWALSLTTATIMTLGVIFAPIPIVGKELTLIFDPANTESLSFVAIHSLMFHYLIILFLFCAIFIRPYKPELKEMLYSWAIYAGYLVVVGFTAYFLETNFAMMLFTDFAVIDTIFQNYPSYIFEMFMWFVYMVIYGIAGFLMVGVSGLFANKNSSDNLERDISTT